jgi:hypothetical protein
MTATAPRNSRDVLPPAVALAFAPLHKRAFGMAIGIASGLPDQGVGLALLSQYFKGYSVSWGGAFVGLAWGFVVGFVGGWFVAFCRNLVIAINIFIIRAKSELHQSRDFLDHI